MPRPPAPQGDSLLFHTTSGRVNPAASVFRPARDSERVVAVPALPERGEAGLQAPSTPKVEFEVRVPPTEGPLVGNTPPVAPPSIGRAPSGAPSNTPSERLAVNTQPSKPPEVALPGSVPWGKARSSTSILEAQGPKPPEVPLSASRVRSNTALVHSGLSGQAATPPRRAAAKASLARSNEPLAMGRPEKPQQPLRRPLADRPEQGRPPAQAAGADSQAAVRKLVLRVRVAEFDPTRARKWSILGLKFSRRPPLLESLLEAESGVQSILLDSLDRDDIESQIGLLGQEGVLRIQGQPTLVTASGRQAKLLTGENQVRFASAAESDPATVSGDLPYGLTLRPVLIGDDQIQLEVAGPRSGIDSQASRDETAPPVAQTGSATVRMQAGQTVAIRGLGHVRSEAEQPSQRNSLAKVLGLGKVSPPQNELVLFVTPEPIRSTPPLKMASRLGIHAPAAETAPRPGPHAPAGETAPRLGAHAPVRETAPRPHAHAPAGDKKPSWLSRLIPGR